MTFQNYGTPRAFIDAVERRFGPIVADLAALPENAKHATFISPEEDSLTLPWAERWPAGNLWLNPPFRVMAPWAAKCAAEAARRHGFIFLLSPASIGTRWFAEHVSDAAVTFGLSPRIQFDGGANSAKGDSMLSVFGYGLRGFGTWRWNEVQP